MKSLLKEDNKIFYLKLLGVVAIIIVLIGTTYAYFAAQAGGTTSTNATVTSNTTDLLTFSINRDISFTVTQNDFAENGTNKSGDATATATLTPNNKTGAATMNYYLYLDLQSNPTVYSSTNTNEDPELMLQVFDDNNQLVTLTGLGTQKTIKGVTGYDITGVEVLQTLLDNHAISASNNTATIENWRVVITLINLDVNQNDNTGKTINAEIIIRQDEQTFSGTIYRNSENIAMNGTTILALNNESVYCEYSSGEDINSCDFSEYWMTQGACESDLVNMGWSGYVCQQETRSFPGIGEYETSVNTIRTKTYTVYCPIGQNNPTCGTNWYYLTEQECLDDIDVINLGYQCTTGTISKPYYIKHEVEDDIISSTEICIFINNNELCFDENYSEEDIQTTLDKMENDLNNVLNIDSNSFQCWNERGEAYCNINDFGISITSEEIVVGRTRNHCYLMDGYSSYCGS